MLCAIWVVTGYGCCNKQSRGSRGCKSEKKQLFATANGGMEGVTTSGAFFVCFSVDKM